MSPDESDRLQSILSFMGGLEQGQIERFPLGNPPCSNEVSNLTETYMECDLNSWDLLDEMEPTSKYVK